MKQEQYITQFRLRKRGWYVRLVTQFLSEPDKIIPNPKFGPDCKMRLFKLARVEEIEKSEEFLYEKEKTRHQSEGQKKSPLRKFRRIMGYSIQKKEKILRMSKEKLIEAACENHNSWQEKDREDFLKMSKDSGEVLLNKICVNYVKHCLIEFDNHVYAGIKGNVIAIRNNILEVISLVYPWLKEECEKQKK